MTDYAAPGQEEDRRGNPVRLQLGRGLSSSPRLMRRPQSCTATLARVSTSRPLYRTAKRLTHCPAGPTAAIGADPFFATPSVFVAATPSLGPAPASLSSISLIGTLGPATSASLSSSPLAVYLSSTWPPASGSLFVSIDGAPSPTGSVTTIGQ